jgi:hypothetical protein
MESQFIAIIIGGLLILGLMAFGFIVHLSMKENDKINKDDD